MCECEENGTDELVPLCPQARREVLADIAYNAIGPVLAFASVTALTYGLFGGWVLATAFLAGMFAPTTAYLVRDLLTVVFNPLVVRWENRCAAREGDDR